MARTFVVLIAALALVLCASASAAPTASQITTPTDNTFKQEDQSIPDTIHVEGTTSGGAGNVDLNCYYGTTKKTLKANVTVAAGAFSVDAPVSTVTGSAPRPYCVLRAVPTGDATDYPPDMASPVFQGPHVGFGRFNQYKISGGPNDTHVNDFFTGLGQKKGYMDYYSYSSCGVDYSFLFDPITFAQSKSVFYCNGWPWIRNGDDTPTANSVIGTRDDLMVDGKPSYAPYSASNAFNGSDQIPGVPVLSFTRTIDPLNGDTHSTEVDPLVNCAPNAATWNLDGAAASWATDCTSFVSTGVTVNRTLTSDQDGRRSIFMDVYNSTDNQAHEVDVLYDEEFADTTNIPSFQFPWISGDFNPITKDQTVPGPTTPGPTTFNVDTNGATADVFASPQGAVTYSMAPTSVHWYRDGMYSYGTIGFKFTVPAGGGFTLTSSHIQGATKDEVNAASAAQRDATGSPSVAITAPANGSTVNSASQLVTGTSSDPGGAVTGVKVNGTAATLNPDGSWSLPVTLTQGENTLTAIASDAAGNTGTASSKVTFTPPVVVTPPPPADKTPPVFSLAVAKTKLGKLLAKGLPVTVGSNEACTFTLNLFNGKTKIGTAKGTLTKAGKLKVTVKLTKKAKKALKKAKKLKATLKLSGKDKAGNAASKSKKLTFKR